MSKNKSGFAPIQIILSILAGTIVLGGVVGGVLYFTKQEIKKPDIQQSNIQQQGKCGDEVCGPAEKANPNLCPKDCDVPDIISSEDKIMENSPYYFIAIHNEPYHGEKKQALSLESSYETLKKMIEKADGYDIKLTLMFSVPWAEYISQSEERMGDLEFWKKNGHEIAAHHHGLVHGNWDGYSDYDQKEAMQRREKRGKAEPYLGDLGDYMEKLKVLSSGIKSGCVNDEDDKRELPDQIIYDTCSGFANYGEVGTREGDNIGGTKGKNEYVSVGIWNGVTRKWLTHFQANNKEREPKAEAVFSSMTSGVYGVVFHSMDTEKQSFDSYLEFLHSQDPEGKKSKTVSQIIEQELLPEKKISENLLNQSNNNQKCGDNICGDLEKANPNLCPKDCAKADSSERKYFDLKYSNVDSEAVKLDLYLPEKTCSGKYPLVIMIHGGAFKGGDKREVKSDFLTKNCFAVTSLNYRFSSEAVFPAGNQDVKSAVRWLRANADKYGLDADNFGAMGGSAGGYYSSFLGVTGDTKKFDVGENLGFSSAVRAVVDEYGLVNISTLAKDRSDAGLKASSVESNYVGCDISSPNCKNATIASPVNYVSKGDAPFLILHGGKDTKIPIKQSQDFYNLLLKNGVEAKFITLPNAGHGGPAFFNYEPQIIEFFNKHLKK